MKTIYDRTRVCDIVCLVVLVGCVLCAPVSIISLEGQDIPHPGFDMFHGIVVEIPEDSLQRGYRPYIESLDPIDSISWSEIMVRVRKTQKDFPDVKLKKGFGLLIKNQMRIDVDGYYEFILASDDGSRLWIDEELIIDNDLIHPMQVRRDSIPLYKGEYPIKLWYYQAMHDKYGFIFQSRYLGPLEEKTSNIRGSIVWDGDILFEFDRDALSNKGTAKLDSLITLLDQSEDVDEITIMGHTDDVGPLAYNEDLSRRRAMSILAYLGPYCDRRGIVYNAVGYGEVQPRVPNDSSQNRAKNRRVEFLIK